MTREEKIEKILKIYNLEYNQKNIYNFGKYKLEIYSQSDTIFNVKIFNNYITILIDFEILENYLGIFSSSSIKVHDINKYDISINKDGYIYKISKHNEIVSVGVKKDPSSIITAKHLIKSEKEEIPYDLYMRLKEGNDNTKVRGYDFDLLYISKNTQLSKPFSNNLKERIQGCNFSKMNEIINTYDKRYYEFIKEVINYFQNEDINILLPIFNMCYNKYEDCEIESILGIKKEKIKELLK